MNVIVHVDEIFLKGKNQGLFIRKLADNIRRLFKGATMRRVGGGFFVNGLREDDFGRFSKVPGVATFAPVMESDRDIEKIKKCLNRLIIGSNTKTFRITASRSDKSYGLTSAQIEHELGAYIESSRKLKVSLSHYDAEIRIDISKYKALVYGRMTEGAGGLPTGSAGKILCLVSGGIDSPVAAYTLMKRGAEAILVHFQNETAVTDEVSAKIIDLAGVLSRYQPSINIYIAPFAEFQKQIVKMVPAAYRMIVSRRTMFKFAERIARRLGCGGLATGDSLGQVASQTLENLSVIYESSDMLKLAPLIGRNKNEITAMAADIGTLDISNRPYQDCCSMISARHPETRASIDLAHKYEKQMDFSILDKIRPISYHVSIHSVVVANRL